MKIDRARVERRVAHIRAEVKALGRLLASHSRNDIAAPDNRDWATGQSISGFNPRPGSEQNTLQPALQHPPPRLFVAILSRSDVYSRLDTGLADVTDFIRYVGRRHSVLYSRHRRALAEMLKAVQL